MKPHQALALTVYIVVYAWMVWAKHFQIAAVMLLIWGCIVLLGAFQRWPFFVDLSPDDSWYTRTLRLLTVNSEAMRELVGKKGVIKSTYAEGVVIIVLGFILLWWATSRA